MRVSSLLLLAAIAQAQGGHNELVDRLSTRLDRGLAGPSDAEHFRPLEPAAADPVRAVVTAVAMAAPTGPVERLELTVSKPGPCGNGALAQEK